MANRMMKGWFKADENALVLGLLGAAAGSATAQATGMTKGWQPAGAALAGAAGGQLLRAFVDPTLRAERKA